MINKNLTFLKKIAFKGLEERGFSDKEEYRERLNYELKVIGDLGFETYFLIMWDIVKFAQKEKIFSGPGRGSAASSLLNYSLKITAIDPIKYNLIFERFMNPERVSAPDIDYDTTDREKIIEYLEQKYGKDQVARVGSLNFLRTKSAVRDIGRVLDKNSKLINELIDLVPPPVAGLWESFEAECEVEPKLKDKKYEEIIGPVEKLWGITRSYGTHAGGVAIAPGPINEFVPLYKGKEGNPVTQVDWRDLEEIGLLKFDILGLLTLEVIKLCLQYLKRSGIILDFENLKDGDEKTYSLINSGNLEGVFQLGGSESIKQLTLSISPKNIKDLALISALFRPGPLTKNKETGKSMTDIAIARKTGEEKIIYLHPLLEPILENTLGVIVFQESIMRIARDLAGFSGPKTDTLRKAIGKKIKELMESLEKEFKEGCTENHIKEEVIDEIWQAIEGSAKYSFAESHAVPYAMITYWTAYLKAHHPIHFYSALLAKEKDPDMVTQYACAIRESGIDILPPDINKSGVYHQPEGGSIRYGLSHIKGMPKATAKEIVEVRERGSD